MDPRGPPMGPDWGPPHPGWGPPHSDWGPGRGWGPPGGGWGSRGPPPPDYWGQRGLPGWGPHPDDCPPRDWGPEEWRREEEWRRWYEECRARDAWGPPGPPGAGPLGPPGPPGPWDMPPGPWAPDGPMGPPPPGVPAPGLPHPVIPPMGAPPMGAPPMGAPPMCAPPMGALPMGAPPPGLPPPGIGLPPVIPPPGVLPPVAPPPDCPPPFCFPTYPPGGWNAASSETETEKPIWIKALLSAPTACQTRPAEVAPEPIGPVPPGTELVTKTKIKKRIKVTKAKTVIKHRGLLVKRELDKPVPGRSIGTITFVGVSFGHIERDRDKEKFTFSFSSFFGNPKSLVKGVCVHFTVVHESNEQIATDIKIPTHGTESVDPEILEGVVVKPLEPFMGKVNAYIGRILTCLNFEKSDCNITLLKDDQILMNRLTDIATNKCRATNIRPKVPETFIHTGETREKGVILSFKDTAGGLIKCNAHGVIPFDVKENLGDVEFTAKDVNQEVEFTVIEHRPGKRAVRICRVAPPLLVTLSSMTTEEKEELVEEEVDEEVEVEVDEDEEEEEEEEEESSEHLCDKPLQLRADIPLYNFELDSELYEGVVSQPIIRQTTTMPGYPGQIHTMLGLSKTNVTFDHRDCGVTLLKHDQVLMNLLIDKTKGKKRAANIRPKIPFTFTHTKEKRERGIVKKLVAGKGVITTKEHGNIPFNKKENLSDTELNANDVNKEVEFTLTQVKNKKRAIRLRRINRMSEQLLQEKKKRQEQEELRRKKMEERKLEIERKQQEEEEIRLEAETKKKEEVAAALAAAREKLTPLGFMMRGPDPDESISKDRFDGTVLIAICKHPPVELKEEPDEPKDPDSKPGQNGATKPSEVKIKVEKEESMELPIEVPKNEDKDRKDEKKAAEVKEEKTEDVKLKPDAGLLVMTLNGKQKKLSFERSDLLTRATMMVGDKVRFNIATLQRNQCERAAYVELLNDSFVESAEERHNGIVIGFSEDYGMIKCSQSPQLYFHNFEVNERKKLELNEKVEFSIVPHDTLEAQHQAIRIKRYTESMFLPVKKLSGVTANKAKSMTIKLSMPSEEERKKAEVDKLKAVVKNLRKQDSKNRSSGSRRRSRSKTPERDKFGRIKRRSSSKDRSSKDRSSREHPKKRSRSRSRDRSKKRSRSRDRSKKRSRSSSSSRSRSRSGERNRENSKDNSRRSSYSHERENLDRENRNRENRDRENRDRENRDRENRDRENRDRENREREEYRRRGEPSPRTPRHMDDELARKKRELEELNEMIAYKKALVEPRIVEPRVTEQGGKTCIDYDHGRLAMPVKEFNPMHPDYPPSKPYGDPYYDRDYSVYRERRYADPYGDRYSDPYYERRPYGPPSYKNRPYLEPPYGEPSRRYTDRYDVYEPLPESSYHDSKYPPGRPYPDDSYRNPPLDHSPPPQQSLAPSGPPFRPPSPEEPTQKSPPPMSPPPKRLSPPVEKPPLDRFLDMLNKKKVTPDKRISPPNDDLLPHERALKEGTTGFSKIVCLPQTKPFEPIRSISPPKPVKPPSPKPTEELEKAEPYDKIQTLLRTIGLKFTSDDMTKLRSQAGIVASSPKSASLEREPQRAGSSRTSSMDRFHSPSPARSASSEPSQKPVNEYESFLDQQELEALQKAQQMQSLTRSISEGTPPPRPPPGPPPIQYQRPPVPDSWDVQIAKTLPNPNNQAFHLDCASKTPPGPPPGPPPKRAAAQAPPGPPPGPPPKRTPGPPTFVSALSFMGQATQRAPAAAQAPGQSPNDPAISTTVARCLQVIETVRTLAQPPAKPAKSVQFNLPSESQATMESEEDIKNVQKEKLEMYNQRLLDKRELDKKKYYESRRAQDKNRGGTAVVPAKPVIVEQKNVWICGHSLIYWAESRAKSPEVGMQLGMDPSRVTLWWRGTQGMTWSQLLPQLHQLKVLWPNPDVLIVHLGGNDLNDSPTDLLTAVRRDLASIRSIFPRCLLVWSHILPRRAWRHSNDSHEVDLVRTTVNRRIHSVLTELGGVSLAHDNIRCGANTGLYRADGVHLSPKGIDVFNLNLQDLLEKWDQEVIKNQ
ncbi:uncharacterized protein [Eucyclogobius newberryi]|uniref:uncharacterized protein n=1 Tax=Eucyclogobius newberryi TaxID=166745 RepID=UPI003B591553